jgi:hypothetical protein
MAASADPFKCKARASSAAVWPRAPQQAIPRALVTLTGEKTVFAPSVASSRYISAPDAPAAVAGRGHQGCFVGHRLWHLPVPRRITPGRGGRAEKSM